MLDHYYKQKPSDGILQQYYYNNYKQQRYSYDLEYQYQHNNMRMNTINSSSSGGKSNTISMSIKKRFLLSLLVFTTAMTLLFSSSLSTPVAFDSDISSSNSLNEEIDQRQYHRNLLAILRSQWDRLLLLLLDPKTKILKKRNGKIVDDNVIVLVMGEAKGFDGWFESLSKVQHSNDLYMVYASYDDEVTLPAAIVNGTNQGISFHTIHIPDATWTEGRNLLAAEALRKENHRKRKYSYWFFLDEDVKPTCHPATDKIYGKSYKSCWEKVFGFMASEAVPEKASTIALPSYLKDGFVSTSNVNGHSAAFKRSRIPYLLPYATINSKRSENYAVGQASNMCIVNTCMANSVVFVPLIYDSAKKHPRVHYVHHKIDGGENSTASGPIEKIRTTIKQNYHDASVNFSPCEDWDELRYYSEGEFSDMKHQLLGPYPSSDELNEHISYTKQSHCIPLKNRFKEWEKRVLSESSDIKPTSSSKPIIFRDDAEGGGRFKKDVLVMVMGEASAFQHWSKTLRDIQGVNLNFIFASHDTEISIATIKNEIPDFQKTIFIPNTTWTEGRNQLAEEALRTENLRGKQFNYWLFLDDDVEPICNEGSEKILGSGSCWQQIFNFLSDETDEIPEMASTIALPLAPSSSAKEGFASASNVDASFAAFRRSTVPYLLPYATLFPGSDQRLSQAANYCIMGTCLNNSAVFIPYVTANDTKACSNCIRNGFTLPNIHAVITQNFHNLSANFLPCHDWDDIEYYHEQGTNQNNVTTSTAGILGPFQTGKALNLQIPPHKHGLCAPLRQRFMEWEMRVLATTIQDSSITTS